MQNDDDDDDDAEEEGEIPELVSIEYIEPIIEYVDAKFIGDNNWTSKQLIDWLLKSDIHFILSHVHQGLEVRNIFWEKNELMNELKLLSYHIGFPRGEQLQCGVFTQNKRRYLESLPKDMVNCSFFLYLNSSGIYSDNIITEFRRYNRLYIL